jgi:hypothetical protein
MLLIKMILFHNLVDTQGSELRFRMKYGNEGGLHFSSKHRTAAHKCHIHTPILKYKLFPSMQIFESLHLNGGNLAQFLLIY